MIVGYTDRHTRPTILLLRVFFAAGTCLTSRCLATKGIHFTVSLPSDDSRDTHKDTD
jgi:hypothetical protein